MGIVFSDQRPLSDWSLTASLDGDVLNLNGTALDFSILDEGDVYPNPNPDIFASDVTRAGGDISVTLFRPVDAAGAPITGINVPVSVTLDPEQVIGAAAIAMAQQAEARAGMVLSFSQLLAGLVAESWITEPEGENWASGNGLPTSATALIGTLAGSAQFAVKARLLRMSQAERLDPLVIALATAEGKTEAEIDAFFVTYGAI